MASTDAALTAKRLWALIQEMWAIEDEIDSLKFHRVRHLREAAVEAHGFSASARDRLTPLMRALKREERPLEAKILELEDTVERLANPELVEASE